jgi:hypothetical protein
MAGATGRGTGALFSSTMSFVTFPMAIVLPVA